MRIAICDDNRAFAKQLRTRVRDYCAKFDYACSCELYTGSEALLKADLSAVQVLFLDIDMPGLNGIDLAKRLRKTLPELILIFVTAYIQYAPSGYQVSAFRYLLKTDLDRDFSACMEDTMEKLSGRENETLFSGKDGRTFSIPTPHILYIEGSSGRGVFLHTTGGAGDAVACRGKLADYVDSLSGQGFLRIQRSFLVNMRHIERIMNYKVLLSNGEVLNASKTEYSDIKAAHARWKADRL